MYVPRTHNHVHSPSNAGYSLVWPDSLLNRALSSALSLALIIDILTPVGLCFNTVDYDHRYDIKATTTASTTRNVSEATEPQGQLL